MPLRRTAHEGLHEVVERAHARDPAGLLEQLARGDADQRRWAARDLAGHPQTAGALGQRLLSERDPAVVEALFTTLSSHANEAAASALLPLLRSEDPVHRNGAIEALAAMPDVVAPRIASLLRDPDPDVRIFTCNLLGELRHPRVTDWLLEVMRRENTVNVVAAAIEALAEAGGPQHVEPLRQAAGRFADDPFIAFAADVAVRRIERA